MNVQLSPNLTSKASAHSPAFGRRSTPPVWRNAEVAVRNAGSQGRRQIRQVLRDAIQNPAQHPAVADFLAHFSNLHTILSRKELTEMIGTLRQDSDPQTRHQTAVAAFQSLPLWDAARALFTGNHNSASAVAFAGNDHASENFKTKIWNV